MKPTFLITSLLIALNVSSVYALDLSSSVKKQLPQKEVNQQSNALVKYAAGQLGMSEETVGAGIGALLKVAKDNISKENFALVSKAIPGIDSYINNAPKVSTSSLTSLLGSTGEAGKSAASLGYLDSAFESIGIPKEQAPLIINSITGYMSSNGYGEAAELLKQGLSFL